MTDIELGLTGEPAPAPTETPAADASVMTLVEHLWELRRRLAIGAVALIVGTAIGFLLSPRIIGLLMAPLAGPRLVFLEVGGGFMVSSSWR